jgi:hypothetical protein
MIFYELKDALSCVVLVGIVFVKCVALHRAVKTKTWERFTLDASWVVCFGSILVFNVALYFWPQLRAPQPWTPSNPLYILRFPGNLLLLALCQIPYIIFAERQLDQVKKKQGVQAKG